MKNNKFIDYLYKYEELKTEIEELKKESLKLLDECRFIECRIGIEKIIDKRKLIKVIENIEIKWHK